MGSEPKSLGSKIWRYTAATALSAGKVMAASGQTIFGMKKIYAHLSDVWSTPVPASLQTAGLVITTICSITINILTRAATIFETLTPDAKKSDPLTEMAEEDIKSPPAAPLDKRTFWQRTTRNSLYYGITASAAISSSFASANAYLGGLNFFSYISQTTINDSAESQAAIQASATYVAASNGYSSFAYNFPPSKDNAKLFANWITNPETTFKQKRTDAWGYRWTLAKCSLNICATPFQAFYSTMNTFEAMGLTHQVDSSILTAIAGASTLTAFTSNLFSAVASAHQYMHPHPEIQRGLDNLPVRGKIYYRAGLIVGSIDSLATGAGASVAIIVTAATAISALQQNSIGLATVALACGASIAYTTQAFSVKYGLVKRLMKWYPDLFAAENAKLMAAQAIANANYASVSDTAFLDPMVLEVDKHLHLHSNGISLHEEKNQHPATHNRNFTSPAQIYHLLQSRQSSLTSIATPKPSMKEALLQENKHLSYQSSGTRTPTPGFDRIESPAMQRIDYASSAPVPYMQRLQDEEENQYILNQSFSFMNTNQKLSRKQINEIMQKYQALQREEKNNQQVLNNLIMCTF